MIIQPKIRGFICTAAHPAGCYESVKQQIEYVKSQDKFEGPKNVLVIGASTGYGLASRIATTYGSDAKTIGVFFERPATEKRTASAGWYNTAAFEQIAHADGFYAKSINGDAFSDEIKQQTIDLIKNDLGKVDLVVYSLASPRRTDPRSGETFSSVLKPTEGVYTNKTVDPMSGEVKEISINPAEGDEVARTVKVMGGEDWEMWMDALESAGVLTETAKTVAYTYIGPELTHPIYKNGSIGKAKDHLQETAIRLNSRMQTKGGSAFLSVNKALVTQASSAIPVVPLYMALLFKVMKEKGIHEGCIEQMTRLFKDKVYAGEIEFDGESRVRVDDWEMREDVQQEVADLWSQVNSDNIESISDIQAYRDDFHKLFGFSFDAVDYDADVDQIVSIPSISE